MELERPEGKGGRWVLGKVVSGASLSEVFSDTWWLRENGRTGPQAAHAAETGLGATSRSADPGSYRLRPGRRGHEGQLPGERLK